MKSNIQHCLLAILLSICGFAKAQNENLKWYSPERLSVKVSGYHSWYIEKPISIRTIYYRFDAQILIFKSQKFKLNIGGGINSGFVYYQSFGDGNLFDSPQRLKNSLLAVTQIDLGSEFKHHIEMIYTPLGITNNRGDFYYHLNYSYNLPIHFEIGKLLTIQPAAMFGVHAFSTKRAEGDFQLWPLWYKAGIQFILY